jgi:FAD/FMN-containing dehydrogenase
MCAIDDDEKLWRALEAAPLQTGEHLIWRANLLPTRLAEFLEPMSSDNHPAFSSSSLWQAGLADGRLRVIGSCSGETNSIVQSLEKARAAARALGGTLVLENAPLDVKNAFDAWGEMGSAGLLMQRVKQQLDPTDMLSPGRFFEST